MPAKTNYYDLLRRLYVQLIYTELNASLLQQSHPFHPPSPHPHPPDVISLATAIAQPQYGFLRTKLEFECLTKTGVCYRQPPFT